MGDDTIDMVILHIDVEYLVTLPTGASVLGAGHSGGVVRTTGGSTLGCGLSM